MGDQEEMCGILNTENTTRANACPGQNILYASTFLNQGLNFILRQVPDVCLFEFTLQLTSLESRPMG